MVDHLVGIHNGFRQILQGTGHLGQLLEKVLNLILNILQPFSSGGGGLLGFIAHFLNLFGNNRKSLAAFSRVSRFYGCINFYASYSSCF